MSSPNTSFLTCSNSYQLRNTNLTVLTTVILISYPSSIIRPPYAMYTPSPTHLQVSIIMQLLRQSPPITTRVVRHVQQHRQLVLYMNRQPELHTHRSLLAFLTGLVVQLGLIAHLHHHRLRGTALLVDDDTSGELRRVGVARTELQRTVKTVLSDPSVLCFRDLDNIWAIAEEAGDDVFDADAQVALLVEDEVVGLAEQPGAVFLLPDTLHGCSGLWDTVDSQLEGSAVGAHVHWAEDGQMNSFGSTERIATRMSSQHDSRQGRRHDMAPSEAVTLLSWQLELHEHVGVQVLLADSHSLLPAISFVGIQCELPVVTRESGGAVTKRDDDWPSEHVRLLAGDVALANDYDWGQGWFDSWNYKRLFRTIGYNDLRGRWGWSVRTSETARYSIFSPSTACSGTISRAPLFDKESLAPLQSIVAATMLWEVSNPRQLLSSR